MDFTRAETIPNTPLESDHPLLEALREALGQILAEQQHQWKRERALIEAQAAAVVADMRAEIVTLSGKFERVITERLSALRDGEPGAPGPKGEPGPPGRDGRFRTVTEWSGALRDKFRDSACAGVWRPSA